MLAVPFIAKEMQGILEEIAREKGIFVHKIVVDSDHVHMFVSVPTRHVNLSWHCNT